MGHDMLEHPSGLYVTRFAGPARENGGSRARYQITTPDGGYAQLNAEQWGALVQLCAAVAKVDSSALGPRSGVVRYVHPDACRPWLELSGDAHKMCPECDKRWCELSPACPRTLYNLHPDQPVTFPG